MKKVAIYARVSTTDKQDLDTQLIPLKQYAELRGWEVFNIYTDTISGSKENRPALDELMDNAQKRKVDIVLVYRFDRFARSSKQLITSLDFFKNIGIDFISYQENIDTSTPAGKVMFTIISAFAEFERAIIQERVKSGLVKARAKGKVLGRPMLDVNVERLKELRNQGITLRKIAEEMNISRATVHKFCK